MNVVVVLYVFRVKIRIDIIKIENRNVLFAILRRKQTDKNKLWYGVKSKYHFFSPHSLIFLHAIIGNIKKILLIIKIGTFHIYCTLKSYNYI